MFSKKCPRCSRKISKDYDFCPHCGNNFRFERMMKNEKDYGLLGKDDLSTPGFPAGGMNLPPGFNNLFNSLLKEVEKQFREADKNIPRKNIRPENSISISIATSTGKQPEIRISGPVKKQKEIRIVQPEISEEDAKKLSKLPKKEAETKVRRMSNKLIYELDVPGVKSLKDVIINKLENSIEIKAFSEDKVYFKLLPVKLPITDYKLKSGKIIIELAVK